MKRIPERVTVREYAHQVSGGQPRGSDTGDPHPDPDAWGDTVETVTEGGIVVAGDGGELLETTDDGETVGEWVDPDHPPTDGKVLAPTDDAEILDERADDVDPCGEGDCLVCGAHVSPGFYLELETPDNSDHNVAGRVCELHARTLAGLVDELQQQADTDG